MLILLKKIILINPIFFLFCMSEEIDCILIFNLVIQSN